MSKKASIAFIGECMVEMSLPSDIAGTADISIAGDTLNTAIYAKRTAPASRCDIFYVTALGTDALSAHALDFIKREQIDTSLIQSRKDRHIGLYAIVNDKTGERDFIYWRNDSAARTLFDGDISGLLRALASFDFIYLSAISLAILPAQHVSQLFQFIAQFRKKGGKLVFDSNYRPALWSSREQARKIIMQAWQATDIALPSLTDELNLFAENNETDVINRLSKAGVAFGVLKRGDLGPRAIGWDDPSIVYPPAKKVVDTTSAGDSFNGCFLAHIMAGNPPAQAAYEAHTLACKVIGHKGAILPADKHIT